MTTWTAQDDCFSCDDLDGGELYVFPHAGRWRWFTNVELDVPYYNGFGDGGYDIKSYNESGTAETLEAAKEAAERSYKEICE